MVGERLLWDDASSFEKEITVRRQLASEPGAGDRIKLDLVRNLRSAAHLVEGMRWMQAKTRCEEARSRRRLEAVEAFGGIAETLRVPGTDGIIFRAAAEPRESRAWPTGRRLLAPPG